MVLSTVSAEGAPSSRVVLLKGLDSGAMVFYTNYDSRKGRELTQNANAALLFFWPELERQVRIEGDIERVAPETSTAYFHSRPFESQLGAASSPQSQVIASVRPIGEDLPSPPTPSSFGRAALRACMTAFATANRMGLG
jgi:pyridoxamine 5'-phosphate oxidase